MKLYMVLLAALHGVCTYAHESTTWTNWAGNQTAKPQLFIAPATLSDLQKTVRFAHDNKLLIQATGKGYSRCSLGMTDECMINMCNLNQVIGINTQSRTITAQAGIELRELSEKLALHGLSLPNLPATSVTLGGALNTATHGTGKTGSLSNFVTEIELVTADGTLLTLSKEKNRDLFVAARAGLGALGIIYTASLSCEPLFDIQPQERCVPLNEVLKNYKRLFEQNDYFQFIWNVKDDTAVCHLWNKIEHSLSKDLATTRPAHDTLLWFCEVGVEKDLASEYAVPFEELEKALDTIKRIYKQYSSQGLIVSPVVVRFANPDKDVLMSPNGDRTVAFINVWCPVEAAYHPLLQTVDTALCNLGGRPHWGKINYMDYEKAAVMYGAKFAKFIAAKNKVDPDNLFSNPALNRLCIKKDKQ